MICLQRVNLPQRQMPAHRFELHLRGFEVGDCRRLQTVAFGKLRDPVEVRYDPLTSVDLSINDTEYPNVKSSAKEFGSFRPPR